MKRHAYLREQVVRAYQAGTPTTEIFARHRISGPTLYRWLRQAGVRPNRAEPSAVVDELMQAPLVQAFLDACSAHDAPRRWVLKHAKQWGRERGWSNADDLLRATPPPPQPDERDRAALAVLAQALAILRGAA